MVDEKIKTFEENIKKFKSDVCVDEKRQKDTDDKLNDSENRSRRNNIRIDGILECEKETWEKSEEKIQQVIKEKLKITEYIIIERAHRVGNKEKSKQSNRPRTIVASRRGSRIFSNLGKKCMEFSTPRRAFFPLAFAGGL